MHFATDASLGKLGRHLRAAGFDTRCQHQHLQDVFFKDIAITRIILTRTMAIRQRYPDRCMVFIRHNDPWKQVRQVIREVGIRQCDCKPFTRCLSCNRLIQRVERSVVKGRVPAFIWQQHQNFYACGNCQRTYWSGSHRARMDQRLAILFSKQGSETIHERNAIKKQRKRRRQPGGGA